MRHTSSYSIPLLLLTLISLSIWNSSCRKLEKASSQGSLAYSSDTLMFDTVFTSAGSSTRQVKIINKENRRLNISSIRLFRGEQSPYFINVNGVSGKALQNIEIEANDSIYVFMSVFINPGNQDDPFIVEDRLVATVGDQHFDLPVLGYGQDAIYIKDSVLSTQTWTKNKPYVIVENALVDEGQTLTIQAGTRVYVHADSRLFVTGNLKIIGTKTDSVVFQGDRIDRRIYFDENDFINGVGGEWGGVYFSKTSYNNQIDYALFKNGGATTYLNGSPVVDATIQVDPDTVNIAINNTPKLIMNNSIIRNSGGYGIFAYGGSVKAENCLIFANAKDNVALVRGGYYQFLGCTIAGYANRISSATEKHYGVIAVDFFNIGNNQIDWAPLKASFINCIIYGGSEDEIAVGRLDGQATPAEISLKNCLYKNTKEILPNWVSLTNNIVNQTPLFVETSAGNLAQNDYHTELGSPDKGAGTSFSGMLMQDLEGITRGNPPSIGCFE